MKRVAMKVVRVGIVLGVLLLCVFSVQAQIRITGTVSDSIRKIPLAYATLLFEIDNRRIAGCYTNKQGEFSFQIQDSSVGIWKFTAKYLDYKDKEMKVHVTSDTTLHFTMNYGSGGESQLGAVTVRAGRPLISKDKNSMTILSRDASRLPTRNLNSIASVSSSNRKSGGGISFLGSRSEGKAYFVDGVRIANNESYSKPQENVFKMVIRDPLSTVSIDVDRASYSNIRRYINSKQLPPTDAVRVEEMINYFQYDYPAVQNDEPISRFTQMTSCPWNKKHQLLQIGIKGKSLQEGKKPNSNLVFLIDVSGSMQSENKLELVKKSLTLLLDNLLPEDRVAIVVYAGSSGLVLPSTTVGTDKVEIIDALYRLSAGGSTAGGAGIALAYKTAMDNFVEEGNNRVILCTDGDFNVGVSGVGELEKLISEKKESGVFLSVLGFGMGNYKDDQLEVIADKGNGNYAYIDNYKEAKKVFMNEVGSTLYTVAKDVKIQVEFNPALVSSYRLIGYENRVLNAEDFNDDKKDAGELGENGTVTFLYELIPAGETDESEVSSIDSLKYQRITERSTASEEYCTVKFRYKEPKEAKSKLVVITHTDSPKSFAEADDNIQLAASLALYGMLLSESKYTKKQSYKEVLDCLDKVDVKDEEVIALEKMVGQTQKLKRR
jgi:Ca-activated chloride channel family protein